VKIPDLKIGKRLGVAFFILMLLLALCLVVGINNASKLNANTVELVNTEWIKAGLANDAVDNARGSITRMLEITTLTDAKLLAKSRERFQVNEDSFNDEIAELTAKLVTPDGKAQMEKIQQARDRYVDACNAALKLLAAGDREAASTQAFNVADPALHAFVDELSEMVKREKKRFEAGGEQSVMLYERVVFRMTMLGIIATIASVGLAFWITVSITRPIKRAVQIAEAVAAGDLTSIIVVDRQDESGQLIAALKAMNDSLVKIVGQVRIGTDTISTASAEIASGNLELSSRTESQASSLEETASSMEELTGTVKQNADNASQANELVQKASDVAVKGGAVVAQVVDTMNSISESARKIVEIISVIDGIAFQTNILALNAAVEAARAGEQGRGFAVVATEVRNLAHRSAAAAKEIKTLINDSVEKVGIGSQLVEQAGTTMNAVVDSVRHVKNIMAEITDASREQSQGIEQVNQAVIEMDNVTQQNAALVEEAAAAAGAMQDQAANLTELVSIFKLNSTQLPVIALPSMNNVTIIPNGGNTTSNKAINRPRLASAAPRRGISYSC
jgi:methyl-accepting chemotaxis protein